MYSCFLNSAPRPVGLEELGHLFSKGRGWGMRRICVRYNKACPQRAKSACGRRYAGGLDAGRLISARTAPSNLILDSARGFVLTHEPPNPSLVDQTCYLCQPHELEAYRHMLLEMKEGALCAPSEP